MQWVDMPVVLVLVLVGRLTDWNDLRKASKNNSS